MTNAVGSSQDPALQPAAAAARQVDAGEEAARRAFDRRQLEGRKAVQRADGAHAATPEPPRYRRVDAVA